VLSPSPDTAATTSRTPSTTRNRRSQPRTGARLKITVESLNVRYRRAVTVRGHFPTEQAALKCLLSKPREGSVA
jgi:transposase-like protein